MKEQKAWLELVEKFRNDIDAIVICPNCDKGKLIVTDIAFDDTDINKGGERLIECPLCGKYRIVLYRTPPENWYRQWVVLVVFHMSPEFVNGLMLS